MAVPDQRVAEPPGQTANLIAFHESIAGMLAEQGLWRQAYAHARQALDIVSAHRADAPAPPRIPEQLRAEFDRLRREHAEAHEQAIRDALTDSYNRRYLDQRLLAPVGNPLPGGVDGLAVALVDLDRFKRVNDTFGHQVGDRVLRRVVELLQEGLPDTGFCARYGGEEFVLVLPGVTAPAAVQLVEAARARVEGYPWRTIAGGLRVTVSIGLDHESPAGSGGGRPQTQLRRADALLYAAKRSGRNAVAYRVDGQIRLAGAAGRRRSADRSDRLTHSAVLIPQVD